MTVPARRLAVVCFATMMIAVLCVARTEAQPLMDLRYPQPVRLSFHGKIDGSEVIEITPTHAYWIHRHWAWPDQAVVLNDVAWNPRKQRSLKNTGKTRFLFEAVDFASARLENVKGRDIVSLETGRDLVRVHICDSPNGADTYEFDIVFNPPSVQQSLRIRADIDGSDRLIIDKTGIWWEHRHWEWPKEVTLGDVRWNPRKTGKLEYSSVLSGAASFSSARMSINEARDMAVLQSGDDRVVVDFADSPLGRAVYDVTIHFGE